MAGKSNKGRNRKVSQSATNSSEAVSSDTSVNDNQVATELASVDANGVSAVSESGDAKPEVKEAETANTDAQLNQGGIHLYTVPVKTQNGEKLELQLSPGDSVMDIRQFLLDAPETCFFTSYDLLLHTKDGSTHHLEDYNEISEVADITTGGCSVEMVADYKRDAARSEDAVTLSYGSELIGMQRDWNEELQSCREFPHATSQERILRDRALYKVTSDFVDAAISGAVEVINRCIPPINPTDPECFHMYVHNNIFFSFAVDADLERLSKKCNSDINSNIGITNSVLNTSENDLSKRDGATSNGENCDGLSSGVRDLAQVAGEAQVAETEQATYASANNDLKGTKAYQEADVPGLYNLAMAIIDYRGHRVVAQSVLPGILQGDKSDSLLYGSVDNGKKIRWNEDLCQDTPSFSCLNIFTADLIVYLPEGA